MANKQQREIGKLNRKLRKNRDHSVLATHTDFNAKGKLHEVTVTKAAHSGFAFMEPKEAIDSKKQRGIRGWRTTGKHPANRKIED